MYSITLVPSSSLPYLGGALLSRRRYPTATAPIPLPTPNPRDPRGEQGPHQIPHSDGVEDADDWSKNMDDAASDEHLAASEVESADPTPTPSEGGGAVEPTSTWAEQAAFYIYVSLAAIFSHLILDRVEKKASIWPLVVVGAANCALLILIQFLADQTSVWAYTVAGVANCALAPLICIFLHLIAHHVRLTCNFLHLIARRVIQWLTSRLNNALFVAIKRVRIELLLLLFASTLLYNENYITQVCISAKAVSLILTRRENEIMDYGSSCPNGKVSLVSVDGLHHICVFIYFLAFFHATYSFLIIVLGRAKIREWKEWEKETLSPSYKFSSDGTQLGETHTQGHNRSKQD